MTQKTRRLGLLVAIATGSVLLVQGAANALPAGAPKTGMLCTNGPTFNLATTTGHVQTPDANSVFMWGYSDTDAENADHPTGGGDFQTPGPVLCVNQGDTVTVNLSNTLPKPVSIVFPGQEGVSASSGPGNSPGLLTREANPSGGDVTYTFVASQPGTYLYESGSDPSKQVEMGLYGALVVRPLAHADWAYGNSSTQFDPKREYLLLLSELDPDLHHAVETGGTYDFTKLHNRYYSINGRQFPDTVQDNGSALLPNAPYGALVRLQPTGDASQDALVRMINAGVLNHPFHPHGNHTREIAQDGRLILSPGGGSASSEHFGETIGSGQTKDYLLRWDNHPAAFNDDWNPNTNPLPVAQPNYRNLMFVDPTFYSGNPYLGYKGTLPTGTTSLNVCGEWYFPLHSHALDEFSNFDEAFGGMGTLLRVDPKGGCFAFPASTKITVKSLNGGTVADLAADETQNVPPQTAKYYRVNSTTSGTRTSDWYGQFSGVPAGAANLAATYKGRNCGTGAGCPAIPAPDPTTTLSIWNWTTSSWVQIAGPTSIGTTDVTMTSAPIASPASYIGTGSNKGLVRVRVLTTRTGTTNFVTGGNLMKLVYDAP